MGLPPCNCEYVTCWSTLRGSLSFCIKAPTHMSGMAHNKHQDVLTDGDTSVSLPVKIPRCVLPKQHRPKTKHPGSPQGQKLMCSGGDVGGTLRPSRELHEMKLGVPCGQEGTGAQQQKQAKPSGRMSDTRGPAETAPHDQTGAIRAAK